jgi:hypothetical protein
MRSGGGSVIAWNIIKEAYHGCTKEQKDPVETGYAPIT